MNGCKSRNEALSHPIVISTFESLGIYWSPLDGSPEKQVRVHYREKGTQKWKEALPMRYNPIEETNRDKADYRGSIVNLSPGTEYRIKLDLEKTEQAARLSASTWSESYPIGRFIRPGNMKEPYIIDQSGSIDGYICIDGTGCTIDGQNASESCIAIKGNYIIIRGYRLTSGMKYGIWLDDCHDIIIEDCEITNWGSALENGFGTNYEGAIYSESRALCRVVIQRCRIHHPRHDANSWAEFNDNPEFSTYHPQGQQGVAFENSLGNHVIRYNEFWSDKDHMFNDILGFGENNSLEGFPGPDTDIYGNYLANCWDDAAEIEGGNRNVRFWNNYIEDFFVAIATAGTTIGPLYIWNNVTGRSNSPPDSKYWEYGFFIKCGRSQEGYKYLFNNTILQPEGGGAGGVGSVMDVNNRLENWVSRNNILHVRSSTESAIACSKASKNIDFDYDLCSAGFPLDQEQHGEFGEPVFLDQAGFNKYNRTGSFQLSSESPGFRTGLCIPNFCPGNNGQPPDAGAHQPGQAVIQYGTMGGYVTRGTQQTLLLKRNLRK